MTSSEYWKKREADALKSYQKDEEAYYEEIQEIYADMMERIQKEIDSFYIKYAVKEDISMAEAKKRVSQLDIKAYARKAKKYVRNRDFSDEANEEMRLYNATMKINRLEMLKANIGLELVSGYDELQKYFEQTLTDRTLDEFKRQAGILGETITDNAEMVHSIVNASFHNATFSDRIWIHQDVLKNQLSSLLQTGLIQGRNPRQLAVELRKYFNVDIGNSERLMRTELARVQTAAQKRSFEKNGFEEYEFIANGTACEKCAGLDGQHFKVAKMMPGTNAPPMHPNCRCSTAAYQDSAEYEAWLDFLDKGGSTDEWQWQKAEKEMQRKQESQWRNIRFKTGVSDTEAYIDAKRKELFLGPPVDATNSWKQSKHSGTVLEKSEYKGYKVDGKKVVIDHSAHERKIAYNIAELYGKDVFLVPRITYPQNISTPDFEIDGQKWDLKTISTSGKNVLYNALRKKKRQANNFIFDISNCEMELDEIICQINDVFRSTHLTFVDGIAIYKDNQIIKIYERNKK